MKFFIVFLIAFTSVFSFAQNEEDIPLMELREIKMEKSEIRKCITCRTDESFSFYKGKCTKALTDCVSVCYDMKVYVLMGIPAQYSGEESFNDYK